MPRIAKEQAERIIANGARILFEYCKDHDIHYLVTGSSGGLDSAVTLGFAHRACEMARSQSFQLTSVGLILPCLSKPNAERLGTLAIKTFHAELLPSNLSYIYEVIKDDVLPDFDFRIKALLRDTKGQVLVDWEKRRKTALGNLKARLRMMLGTYYVANMIGGLVLATGNLSETLMGFWTICGDVGDFNLIGNILKGLELYDIAQAIGVPQEIIDAKPDADLGDGNDEEQLGAPYPVIDQVMVNLIQRGFNPSGSKQQLDLMPEMADAVIRRIATRSLNTAFKRKGTIVLTREELGLPPIKNL